MTPIEQVEVGPSYIILEIRNIPEGEPYGWENSSDPASEHPARIEVLYEDSGGEVFCLESPEQADALIDVLSAKRAELWGLRQATEGS